MHRKHLLSRASKKYELQGWKLKVPLPIFKIFYDPVKDHFTDLYVKVAKKVIPGKYVAPCGINVAKLFFILCCIAAAKMKTMRLDVIRRHMSYDKTNEKIPMSIFLLLPQFLLTSALDKISEDTIDSYFTDQVPESVRCYLPFSLIGVIGAGTMGSALSVDVVGKISENGGKPSWFQDTLYKSILDNYYWTLTYCVL